MGEKDADIGSAVDWQSVWECEPTYRPEEDPPPCQASSSPTADSTIAAAGFGFATVHFGVMKSSELIGHRTWSPWNLRRTAYASVFVVGRGWAATRGISGVDLLASLGEVIGVVISSLLALR